MLCHLHMIDSSDSPLSGMTPAKLLIVKMTAKSLLPTYLKHLWKLMPYTKTYRGQDVRLFICSYVAEKPGGCLYKITPDNSKFHSLFKSYLYLQINLIYHALQWNFLLLFCSFITKKVGKQIDQYSNLVVPTTTRWGTDLLITWLIGSWTS